MQVHEALRRHPAGRQSVRDCLFGDAPRRQDETLFLAARLHANAPQGIEIELHRVARRASRQRIEMGEAMAPETVGVGASGRDRVRHTEHTGEPGAPRMLGQVNEQIVMPRPQRSEQLPFLAELGAPSAPLPVAIDGMQLRQRRMVLEHRRGFAIHQRVDFDLRRMPFQYADDGRGEEHIAVMAQLRDQHAAQPFRVDGIIRHPLALAGRDSHIAQR